MTQHACEPKAFVIDKGLSKGTKNNLYVCPLHILFYRLNSYKILLSCTTHKFFCINKSYKRYRKIILIFFFYYLIQSILHKYNAINIILFSLTFKIFILERVQFLKKKRLKEVNDLERKKMNKFLGLINLPIIPQPTRGPEFSVTSENWWPPLPRSSLSAWTTIVRLKKKN